MKTIGLNHPAKSKFLSNTSDTKKTLINSLSPNFSYMNKSGGIVNPEQCCLY